MAKRLILSGLVILALSASARAFLVDCREVTKDAVCRAGEKRADFQAMNMDPKTKEYTRRWVYRCCKDSCDER